MVMCKNRRKSDQAGDGRKADETGSAIHILITAAGGIRTAGTTAVMTLVFRLILAGMAHVMRCFLVLVHGHITEPSLQRLGAERQNQNENQKFHI